MDPFDDLFKAPRPFEPNPPKGGGSGKMTKTGNDAMNEARKAQGKPVEGKGKNRAQRRAESKGGKPKKSEKAERDGEAERAELKEIERKLARERDYRRKYR